uniref:CKLF like MARVEL transmembrane domain containing 7 n=1 Tax=Rousettus aegyptiacus TaxID=9407 RepID=A0A7J8HMZ5_ROUAE|nr:CKLF like MARVEL transmembrane domain containing 7 [Rousettus aegyptiacus]
MSQGAGLVRTTCSSSAFGPAAGAGPRGAGPSEGLLDPIYPRTHGALLKVAQMVTLLIAFICVRSAPWTGFSAYRYFEVVTICNFIMILAFHAGLLSLNLIFQYSSEKSPLHLGKKSSLWGNLVSLLL